MKTFLQLVLFVLTRRVVDRHTTTTVTTRPLSFGIVQQHPVDVYPIVRGERLTLLAKKTRGNDQIAPSDNQDRRPPPYNANSRARDVFSNLYFYQDQLIADAARQRREELLKNMTVGDVYLQYVVEYPSGKQQGMDDLSSLISARPSAIKAFLDPSEAVAAPRSSKKSKLEEAKRRAKEWGMQDKKKLEAAKVKGRTVEQPLSPPAAKGSPAPVGAAAKAPTPETIPKSTKTQPRKARVSSLPTTKKSSTTGTPTANIINIKNISSTKAPAATTTPATTTKNNTNAMSTSEATPITSATPANAPIPSLSSQSAAVANTPYATGTVPFNPDYMAQYMMTHQPPAALFPPPVYSQSAPAGYVPANAAPVLTGFFPYSAIMMQHPQVVSQQLSSNIEVVSKQSTLVTNPVPSPAPTSYPAVKPVSATANTRKNTHQTTTRPDSHDSDEELVPPPPTLQMQISQQVLANASASLKNEPAPHTKPPPEAFCTTSYPTNADSDDDDEQSESYEHDDQPIIVDVDDLPMESTRPTIQHPTTFTPWFLLVTAVALILSLLAANTPSNTYSSPTQPLSELKVEPLDIPCFQDSHPQYQMIGDGDEMQTILIESCENLDAMLPCPSLGYCQDGKLARCTHDSFQVNAAGTACELTLATKQETIALWMAALEERTIADLCVAGGSHAELPLFEYQKMQLLYPSTLAIHPLDKTVMQTAFATHEEQGRWFIGLPDNHSFVLPLRCRMAHSAGNLLKTILAWIGKFCWKIVTVCTKLAWSMMSSYPLISFIGLLTVLGVRQVQSFQKHRINLVKDVARMRDMAFDRLQDQSEIAHAVLHLRDDLVATLTARDDVLSGRARQQRDYWITHVWPRVIPQLQQDNRIKKTQRVEMGGKRRDYWQWVAAPRSTTKSNSSNNNTTNNTKKKQVSIAVTKPTTNTPQHDHKNSKKLQ